MKSKQILFKSEARDAVLRGAAQITDAIRVTLGPKSKCVLIEKKWGTPIVCNDGVTIAKEFEIENATENLGAQMIRQAAEKTGEKVGDGTSTSAILTHALYAEGVKNIAAGASAVDLKKGLDRGLAAAAAALARLSRPVTSKLRIRMIGQDVRNVQLKQMQEAADVQSTSDGKSMREMIEEADANLLLIIKDMREAVKAAEESNDPGTVDLFSKIVQIHEKHEWFLREILKQKDGLVA